MPKFFGARVVRVVEFAVIEGKLEYLDEPHSELLEVWDDSGRMYYPGSREWDAIEEEV